jgi:PAS domain S-box-containing protein
LGKRLIRYLVVLALLAACSAGVIYGSSRLRWNARQTWLDQANRAVSRTTDVAFFWLSLYHAQLRGIGALFYGSSEVSEDELLDALEVTESIEAAIPMTTVAHASLTDRGDLVVGLSTDSAGLLAAGSDLSNHDAIREAVTDALDRPDNVIMSRVFRSASNHAMVILAFAAPNGDTDGALLTPVDLKTLIDGLYALHIPQGVRLRAFELPSGGQSQRPDPPFLGEAAPPPETVQTFTIITDSGKAQWEFHWDILPEFRGGPATEFADAVLWSGLLVTGLALSLIGMLFMQNARVRRLVTERTAELRESEKRVSTILETSSEGFWFIDNKALTLDVNETMCRILGRSRADIIGRPTYDFVDEENAAIFSEQLALRDQGHRGAYEVALSRPDGSKVPCLFSATPYVDDSGGKIAAAAMVTDITELKKAQQEMLIAMKEAESAAREAEAANRAKSVFLANVSHEIRTPMNAITGFAEILDRTLTDRQQKEYVSSIKSSGDALLGLFNDILDLSKLEAGDLDMDWTDVDLLKIFADLQNVFAPRAKDKGLTFSLKLDPQLPRSIELDQKRFVQILHNLLDNALKFTHAGSISLEAGADLLDGQTTLRIDVSDTGIGIPEDQVERVFAPFTQKQDQSINEYGGTGLGLTLTRRLLDALGGRVTVTSQVDAGSTFHIVLGNVTVADKTPIGEQATAAPQQDVAEASAEGAAWSPETLSDATRAALPDIVTQMANRIASAAELARTLTINDVENFATWVKELGDVHELAPVTRWADRLDQQASMFEMDAMAETLGTYPDLVEEIRSLTQM